MSAKATVEQLVSDFYRVFDGIKLEAGQSLTDEQMRVVFGFREAMAARVATLARQATYGTLASALLDLALGELHPRIQTGLALLDVMDANFEERGIHVEQTGRAFSEAKAVEGLTEELQRGFINELMGLMEKYAPSEGADEPTLSTEDQAEEQATSAGEANTGI